MQHGKQDKTIKLPKSRLEGLMQSHVLPLAVFLFVFGTAFMLAIIPIGQSVKDAHGAVANTAVATNNSEFESEVIYDAPVSTKYATYKQWDDPTNRAATERLLHTHEKARANEVANAINEFKEAERIAAEEAAKIESENIVYYDTYYDYQDYNTTYTSYDSSNSDYGSLYTAGVQYDGNYRYTWYSQNVLPGGGLNIPGRHVGEGGYIMDGDDNIVLASSDLAYGTEVSTPYGNGKVYDSGCASGTLDVYTNW